jgi:hypothetical protein
MVVVIEKYFYSDQDYSTEVRGVFDDVHTARLTMLEYFTSVNAHLEHNTDEGLVFISRPLGEQILIEFKEVKINELCT